MSYVLCHLFHDIQWFEDSKARDLNGIMGIYGQCKCGRNYFKNIDTNRVFDIPQGTMMAFKVLKKQ